MFISFLYPATMKMPMRSEHVAELVTLPLTHANILNHIIYNTYVCSLANKNACYLKFLHGHMAFGLLNSTAKNNF